MALKDELADEVKKIFEDKWEERDGQKVPETEDIQLGNHAVKLDGTVLYADLTDSTNLVNSYKPHFAAEVYKSYLFCAAKVIRNQGGVITAYDGDRIMAVFIGDKKNTAAATAGLQICGVVQNLINPAIKKQYPTTTYKLDQSVGIDTSPLYIARTGTRGANDLVWVGRSANYAAKLCSLRIGAYKTWITSDVYLKLNESMKYYTAGGVKTNIWTLHTWKKMDIKIYASRCLMPV
jgi:class 3 adenylate cyclase